MPQPCWTRQCSVFILLITALLFFLPVSCYITCYYVLINKLLCSSLTQGTTGKKVPDPFRILVALDVRKSSAESLTLSLTNHPQQNHLGCVQTSDVSTAFQIQKSGSQGREFMEPKYLSTSPGHLYAAIWLSKWLIATLGPHKKGPALALDFKGSGSAGHGRLGSLGKNLWDRTQCRRICRENSCVHHPCKWGNGSKAGQRGCQIVIQVPWELGWPQGTLRSLNQCFPPWEQKGRSTYSHLNSSLGVAPQKRTWPGASCLSVGETIPGRAESSPICGTDCESFSHGQYEWCALTSTTIWLSSVSAPSHWLNTCGVKGRWSPPPPLDSTMYT